MQQLQNQHALPPSSLPLVSHIDSGGPSSEAPPKQVAMAMERLSQAARIIAEIRLGADRLLEALFIASQAQQSKPLSLFIGEDASMRQHLQDLRSIGRKLEESGVLNESLRSRSNSWGLHMPLVCPDGAVVAYAWKRQLAGQAGASAVDRTRLAFKAFTDQKRRFFPRLDDDIDPTAEPVRKKHHGWKLPPEPGSNELDALKTLPDILAQLEKVEPTLKVSTYGRLDWLKRATSLPGMVNEYPGEMLKHNFHGSGGLRPVSQPADIAENVAVIELFFPSLFRAVVSLHPVGSIEPDAVAFFSPDEKGSHVHARGFSVSHVFRHVTEYAATALQYFLSSSAETALRCLLLWICRYQTLFTKQCSKCRRLLAMDRKSALILPPVHRPYKIIPTKITHSQGVPESGVHRCDDEAYHMGCSTEG